MKQELKWFEDREMGSVIMVSPEGKEVEATILNEKESAYYYDLQDKGFTFKPKITIHRAPPAECESCSA